jgi:hypothetical protein
MTVLICPISALWASIVGEKVRRTLSGNADLAKFCSAFTQGRYGGLGTHADPSADATGSVLD